MLDCLKPLGQFRSVQVFRWTRRSQSECNELVSLQA